MRGFFLTGLAIAAVTALLASLPSPAAGQDLAFAPQITSMEGYAELGASAQTTENTQNGVGARSSSTSLRESIGMSADGFAYHPRFLLFHTRLLGSLTEQNDTGNLFGSYPTTATTANYELRAFLLPEHPYTLELFTLHQQATIPAANLQTERGTIDVTGANFYYKSNPYFFHSGVLATTVDSGHEQTDSRTFRLNGTYAGSVISDTATYSHTDASSSSGLQARRNEYGLGIVGRSTALVLDSHINNTETDQEKPELPDIENRSFSWTEHLTATLPWNFNASARYVYANATTRTSESATEPEEKDFNRQSTTTYNISHRLYQSLTTNYTRNDADLESSSGRITTSSDTLNSVYTKGLPVGRLTASIQLADADSERTGMVAVLDEIHSTAIFGSFQLALRNVVGSTIIVRVKDPATGGLLILPSGGYLVSQLGDITEITIQSVSPLTPQPDPAYVYEFHVTYSLQSDSRITMQALGYSLKLDFLDNLLSVYTNYSTATQKVEEGSLPGGTGKDVSTTVGMTAQSGPYSGLIEHQTYRSWQNPSETWKTSGQYRSPLTENANIAAVFSYAQIDHLAVSSDAGESPGVREKTTSVSVTVDRRFPRDNLNVFATASYTRSRSYAEVDTRTVTSYAIWRVGLLTVNGGVQLNRSESDSPSGRVVLAWQYYYVTVNRKLF